MLDVFSNKVCIAREMHAVDDLDPSCSGLFPVALEKYLRKNCNMYKQQYKHEQKYKLRQAELHISCMMKKNSWMGNDVSTCVIGKREAVRHNRVLGLHPGSAQSLPAAPGCPGVTGKNGKPHIESEIGRSV